MDDPNAMEEDLKSQRSKRSREEQEKTGDTPNANRSRSAISSDESSLVTVHMMEAMMKFDPGADGVADGSFFQELSSRSIFDRRSVHRLEIGVESAPRGKSRRCVLASPSSISAVAQGRASSRSDNPKSCSGQSAHRGAEMFRFGDGAGLQLRYRL